MIRIIPASLDDVPELVLLLTLLFTLEKDFTPNPVRQRRGLEMIIRNPEIGTILVLKDSAAVVGMVNLLFTISTAEGGRVATLEDFVLDPAYRGRGLGSRLLRQALAVARRRGSARVTVLTDRSNRRAMRLYQRFGFSRSSMTPLRLPLKARPRIRDCIH
jgi:ribosomal protein S18 acetylase RimI-like enzyme